MVQITAAAAEEMKKALEKYKDEMSKQYIRLDMGIGCGGPQLKLSLEETVRKEDLTFEIDGINMIMGDNLNHYFHNTKIDFVKNIFGVGEFKLITL